MTDVPVSADPGEINAPVPSSEAGKYVYCIIRSDRQHDFGAIGIGGGGRVTTISYQDLAAIVSRAYRPPRGVGRPTSTDQRTVRSHRRPVVARLECSRLLRPGHAR